MKQNKIFKFIICIFFISNANLSFGQCTKCTSFKEALIKPELVKTIQINSAMTGIVLDSIPNYIDTFPNLEKLFLTDQNISYLPNSLQRLPKLKELSFGGCKLTTLPDFIFEMKNLKELILFYNKFPKKYKIEIQKKFKKEMPHTKILIEED